MTGKNPSAQNISFHDNLIYGLHLATPDPDASLWRSDLVLDIDHIVDWICGTDGGAQFRVAPATLIFHDVTDLKMSIDFDGSDHRQTLNELSIADITTQPASASGAGDYFHWRIALNLPQGGEIAFGASGYTLTLRANPVLLDEQRLPPANRPHLMRLT
ncbi:MAG: hypothetical protein O3C34_14215 [Proteobacteria bacterium]|nr:hypothetical protein [Pseudomonadota bacterium]